MYKKPLYQEGGSIQEKVVMMTMLIEVHIELKDPLREGDIQIKVEGYLVKEDSLIRDLLGEDIPIEMEDPYKRRIPGGGPPDGNGGPPDGDGGPLDLLVEKDHQVLKVPWISETHNSADFPSNI